MYYVNSLTSKTVQICYGEIEIAFYGIEIVTSKWLELELHALNSMHVLENTLYYIHNYNIYILTEKTDKHTHTNTKLFYEFT